VACVLRAEQHTTRHLAHALQDLASFQAVLLALARFVAPPGGQQQQEGDGTSALPAPKVAAVGLVDPTPQAITAAVSRAAGLLCQWLHAVLQGCVRGTRTHHAARAALSSVLRAGLRRCGRACG
jgi:hypothetical protein